MSFLLLVQESPKTTAAVTENVTTSIPLWSRSVGSMKCQLSGLVRPKSTAPSSVTSSADCSSAQESVIQNSPDSELNSSNYEIGRPPNSSEQCATGSNTVSAGLAGLGAYSSSSGSDNDEQVS